MLDKRRAGPPQASLTPEGLEPAALQLLEQLGTGDRGEASREPRPARPGALNAVKSVGAGERRAGPPASSAPEGLEPAAPQLLEQLGTGDRGEASREPRPARPRVLHAVKSVGAPLLRHGLGTRAGVSPSCVGLPAGSWASITDFLVQRFPAIARSTWLARMQAGLVVDEHGQSVTPDRPYQAHLRVYYYRALDTEPRIPFEETIVFQDAHLVVADKPHFLPVTPSGTYLQETLLVRLKNKLGLNDLSPLHRIDRETAGLVLLCVQRNERNAYQKLFRQHAVYKRYLAIAPWRDELVFPLTRQSRIVEGTPFFRQCEVPGAPNSHTRIDVLQVQGQQALYALEPVTGKKHQLRVHMNALGLPLRNDRMYPPVAETPPDDYRYPLQLLAQRIAFTDPLTGQARQFESQQQLQWPPTPS